MTVVVVGAGVTGLALADDLARRGHSVVVVEREECVGGLARSFVDDGFVFDVGPHRFQLTDPGVASLVSGVLGDAALEIDRRSGVRLFGRDFEWPLDLSSILHLPLPILVRTARDLVRRRVSDGSDFESYSRARFGETLYQSFFRPYTERFTGLRCRDLDREWGETGLERALIDRGLDGYSIGGLLRTALRRRPGAGYVYPRGGIGEFSSRLARRGVAAGVDLRTSAGVDRVDVADGRIVAVRAGGEEIRCDLLAWTAPLPVLCELLGMPRPVLPFLDLDLYRVRVEGPCRTPYQWCYTSDPDLSFSRVSVPVRFDPGAAPPGTHGLCVERPVPASAKGSESPAAMVDAVLDGLRHCGLLAGSGSVLGVETCRVPEAYPLYVVGFRATLARVEAELRRFGNLRCLGRSGSFWYNNMDHSIRAALDAAEEIGRSIEGRRPG